MVGVLAFLASLDVAAWASSLWPLLILIAAVLLLLVIYPHHALANWPAIWRDAHQRQHTLMALVIGLAGAAEVSRGNSALWGHAWPAAQVFSPSCGLSPS